MTASGSHQTFGGWGDGPRPSSSSSHHPIGTEWRATSARGTCRRRKSEQPPLQRKLRDKLAQRNVSWKGMCRLRAASSSGSGGGGCCAGRGRQRQSGTHSDYFVPSRITVAARPPMMIIMYVKTPRKRICRQHIDSSVSRYRPVSRGG